MGPIAFGAELEPGDTYLLNSFSRIESLMRRVEDPANGLALNVGLNLDIAHMRIAGIRAETIDRKYRSRIVHAHIADHPGIHTHDQVVGSWTNVAIPRGGYFPYIKMMLDRAADYKTNLSNDTARNNELPFSRCIAIELEGSNQSFSIHDSVARLRHVIELVQGRSGSG